MADFRVPKRAPSSIFVHISLVSPCCSRKTEVRPLWPAWDAPQLGLPRLVSAADERRRWRCEAGATPGMNIAKVGRRPLVQAAINGGKSPSSHPAIPGSGPTSKDLTFSVFSMLYSILYCVCCKLKILHLQTWPLWPPPTRPQGTVTHSHRVRDFVAFPPGSTFTSGIRNRSGSAAPPGTHLAHLTSSTGKTVRKLLRLR
jgi:hypothetical protein